MRIALVIDSLSLGGAEGVVQRLALGLAKRGHLALIICLKDASRDTTTLRAAGVGVISLHARPRELAPYFRLAAHLREHRIELAHAHSAAALVAALPACWWAGIPIVRTRHGALLGRSSIHGWIADQLDRFVDQTVVVAQSIRSTLPFHRGRSSACFIPNGIDVAETARACARVELERQAGRRLDGPVVLSVGTVCREKDTLSALSAFARVLRSEPTAVFAIVGAARDTTYEAAVSARIAELHLQAHVIRLGPVDDAWRLMSGADLFLLSSETEAMPLAVIEAMSQGVPIVATAVGDVGSLHGNRTAHATSLLCPNVTALLAPPRDPRALADAMLATLHDPRAAHERARLAHERYLKHFTAGRMIQQHEALYASLLKRHAARATRPRQSPLRILMVGPAEREIGGINSVIDSLSVSLRRRGHVVSRFGWPESAPPHAPRRSLISRVLRQLRSLAALGAAVLRQRPDVVHLHTCSGTSFFRTALDQAVCRLLGRRTAIHIHGGRFERFCAESGRLARWLICAACGAADQLIALSERSAGALRQLVGDLAVGVLPNAVSNAVAPPRSHPRGPCAVLYIGEIRRAKGIFELLDAARLLADRGVAFDLTLAGPATPSESTDWHAEITQRGLGRIVRWIGPVRGDAKHAALAAAEIVVLPSHVEAMPMVMLEAAGARRAVVATNVGDIPELVGPELGREMLVPPCNVGQLADTLEGLITDTARRERLAAALAERVRVRHDIEHVTTQLVTTYERACRRTHRRRPDELLARLVTYPLHEALRERRTLAKLQELVQLSSQTRDEVERACRRRLSELLRFATSELPYFRARAALLDAGLDTRAALARLPVLGKADIRAATNDLVWRGAPGGLHPMTSGGTSGDTLHFVVDRIRQAEDHAARLFMQGLFGVRPGDRRVHLWGSPIESRPSRTRRLRDLLIGERMLSAFDLSDAALQRHSAVLLHYEPRVLYGYPSALARLAQYVRRHYRARHFASLRVVILTGEEITAEQRAVVAEAFGAPVASEYGNREVGLIAHECPAGGLHLISPHIHVEIVSGGAPVEPDEVGNIVCTTLNTRAQPFIRYRVGDIGKLLPNACNCGLPFPLMQLEGGKITGLMALPDGRYCHGAVSSYALRGLPGILAFRTHQRRVDHIEVLLQVDATFDPSATETVRGRYRRLLGPSVRVDCRVVAEVPPDPSGKRRHFVSDVAGSSDAAPVIANVGSSLDD